MGNFPSVVKKAFDKLFGLKQMRVRLCTHTSALCRHVETRSLCARKLNTDSEFVVVGRFVPKAVMLGLDAAGKTTILYKLHIGEVLSTVPTIGARCVPRNNARSWGCLQLCSGPCCKVSNRSVR
jgi:hypothetical protein